MFVSAAQRSSFLQACLDGNEPEKETLLKRGLVLDIHEAAAAGDATRVEQILSRNPGSVNHRDSQDATSLHYGAACGQIAVVNVLLQKGADLSAAATGLDDATPLHFAAAIADGKTASLMVETLAGNGANSTARKKDGTTPLQIAAHHGHLEAVTILIRRGADPNEAAGVLKNASSIPRNCETGRYRGVKREDTYGLPQSWINEFVIASHFDLEKVKRLHGQCSDLLLTRSTWDEIGIEAAAHMGREDIADYFIEKGSPVSLCTATMLGQIEQVRQSLAEDHKRIHERGAHDFPALWYTAFGKERPEILELLLESGADVNAGMMGNTTRELAEKKQYHKLLDILKAHSGFHG